MISDVGIVGDPLEKAAFQAIDWIFSKTGMPTARTYKIKQASQLIRFSHKIQVMLLCHALVAKASAFFIDILLALS